MILRRLAGKLPEVAAEAALASDPEKYREYKRRYYEAHRDEITERNRLYYQAHRDELRERARETSRRYREANLDAVRERNRSFSRRRYAADPEKAREKQRLWRDANREKIRAANRVKKRLQAHGVGHAEWFAQQWTLQGGLCYLHGGPITISDARIDHDHSCDCGALRTCVYCRRGIACNACNTLIGLAGDEPTMLRKIADNLEAARDLAQKRIATKPMQPELPVA